MTTLTAMQDQLSHHSWDLSALRAMFINTTLKKSPKISILRVSWTSRPRSCVVR